MRTQQIVTITTCCALLCSLAPPLRAGERTRLAVLDLTNKGVQARVVQNLTDVLTASLAELNVLDVISRADISRILELEEQRQLVGCETDSTCLAEVGGALGVALVVSGSVGKVGSSYLINLDLTDTKEVEVRAREQREVGDAEELASAVRHAARRLVRGLLEEQSGYLVLEASEIAANVEIDGRLVGVTPLPRQMLGGGPHRLTVQKKGFVAWTRDVEIQKDEYSVVDASLVPSPDFIEEYEARARMWRRLSFLAGGTGAAAVAFALGGYLYNGTRADKYEDDLLAANCQRGASGTPTGDCAQLAARYDSIRRFDLVTQAAAGVGIIASLLGAYWFLTGPEPGIYDAYRSEEPPQSGVLLSPSAAGFMASGFFRF